MHHGSFLLGCVSTAPSAHALASGVLCHFKSVQSGSHGTCCEWLTFEYVQVTLADGNATGVAGIPACRHHIEIVGQSQTAQVLAGRTA